MDILTIRGRETLKQEARAVQILSRHYPDWEYHETPKDRPAKVDAMLSKEKVVQALVETKCRTFTLAKLQSDYQNEWLITASKIEGARGLCEELCIPLYGFLYLVPNDCLLVIKIINNKGKIIAPHRVAWSTTKRTVNGGSARRENMFIKMDDARHLSGSGQAGGGPPEP